MSHDPFIAAVSKGRTHWAVGVRPRWEESLVESRARLYDHVEKSLQQDDRFNNLTLAAPGEYCFVMEWYQLLRDQKGSLQAIPFERYLLPVCEYAIVIEKLNVPSDNNFIQIH